MTLFTIIRGKTCHEPAHHEILDECDGSARPGQKPQRPVAPADRPTITSPPAASGIALALGQEIAVVSDPEDFIHELTHTGLLAPDEAETFRRRLADDGDLHGARAVSRELVRSGRLTPYQAAAVLQGKTRGLLIGDYLVLDRLGPAAWASC